MNKFTGMAAALAVSVLMFGCSQKEAAPKATGGATAATATTGTPAVQASFNHDNPDVVKVCIKGAHCDDCYNSIKSSISGVDGVKGMDVDKSSKSVFVQVSNKSPEVQKNIEAAVVNAGFGVENAPAPSKKAPCCIKQGDKDCKDDGKCDETMKEKHDAKPDMN